MESAIRDPEEDEPSWDHDLFGEFQFDNRVWNGIEDIEVGDDSVNSVERRMFGERALIDGDGSFSTNSPHGWVDFYPGNVPASGLRG